MKTIKRIFLVIIVAVIIFGIGFLLFKKVQEHQIMKVVKSGHVIIDQELHDWNVCKDNSPIKLEMYVRNNSEYKITGKLVFLTTLSRKGLEKDFLEELINCYGEERVKKDIKEMIAKKQKIGKFQAVYDYILRGRQLPEGQEYEPIKNDGNKDYIFKFRKQVLLQPGEILKIDHEENIPLNERGGILTIKAGDIEF